MIFQTERKESHSQSVVPPPLSAVSHVNCTTIRPKTLSSSSRKSRIQTATSSISCPQRDQSQRQRTMTAREVKERTPFGLQGIVLQCSISTKRSSSRIFRDKHQRQSHLLRLLQPKTSFQRAQEQFSSQKRTKSVSLTSNNNPSSLLSRLST